MSQHTLSTFFTCCTQRQSFQ